MAFFSAYFDASGRRGDPKHGVMTVAGFVSTVNKWERFDREWRSILKSEGVELFHMTDFVSSKGEFAKGWKGKTDRRREFIDRLAKCLYRNVNKSFRATLILSDYEKVNKLFAVEENLGLPYALCSMMCVHLLRKWATNKGSSEKLLYYFEDGDADKGNFEEWHKREHGEPPLFQSKQMAVGFQPADFAGWKVRTAIQESIKSDHTIDRGIELLRSIDVLKKIPKDAGVINEETLLKYCQGYRVPARSKPVGM
jgi:hypothetical protein